MRRCLFWPGLALGGLLALGCGGGSSSKVATQVTVGEYFACARMGDGAARCWGSRRTAALGAGMTHRTAPLEFLRGLIPASLAYGAVIKPLQVVNLDGVAEVAAGRDHACARHTNGRVWCWGNNSYGQIASEERKELVGRGEEVPFPVRVSRLEGAVQITSGTNHACARRSDGTVWCWGEPTHKSSSGRSEPYAQPMAGLSSVTDVRAGGETTCVLIGDGTVRCWGRNDYGQTGDGTARSRTVVAKPTRVAGVKDAAQIAVGRTHGCAKLRNNDVRCWGREVSGHKRLPTGFVPTVMAAGEDGSCGLTADGSIQCWGDASLMSSGSTLRIEAESAPALVGKLSNATQIAVGRRHVCAMQASGAVTCWGESWRDTAEVKSKDAKGPFPVEGLGKAVHLAARGTRTCAVIDDGTVRCWGLKRALETVEGVRDAVQVAVGEKHACVRRKKGPVMCWGDDERGQLGRGTTDKNGSRVPTEVPGTEETEQVVAAENATCVRDKAGAVRCWGVNTSGQLGMGVFSSVGSESLRARPVTASLSGPAVALSAGAARFCALHADGEVSCWGNEQQSACTGLEPARADDRKPPTPVQGLREVAQIAVATTHACARRKDGSVMCWGSNEAGQMADGTQGEGNLRASPVVVAALAGATELVLGPDVTCGKLAGGRMWCFGARTTKGWEIPGMQAAASVAVASVGERRWEGGKGWPGCAAMANGALACWGSSALGASDGDGPPVQVRW